LIAAGKSSVVKWFEKEKGWLAAHEPTNENDGSWFKNEYLEDFYEYMDLFNFHRQFLPQNNCFLDSQVKDYLATKGKLQLTRQIGSGESTKDFVETILDWESYMFNLTNLRWVSSTMQTALETMRYEDHQWCSWNSRRWPVIADSLIWTDHIFARMLNNHPCKLITDRDFRVYRMLLSSHKYTAMYPDVIVYIRVSPEKAYERYLKRKRKKERVTLKYLQMLYKYYEDFVDDMRKRCLIIDVDWEEDNQPYEVIYDTICESLPKHCDFLTSMNRKSLDLLNEKLLRDKQVIPAFFDHSILAQRGPM